MKKIMLSLTMLSFQFALAHRFTSVVQLVFLATSLRVVTARQLTP